MRSTTNARLALIRSARSWFGIGTAMVLANATARPSPRESLERWICEANRRRASATQTAVRALSEQPAPASGEQTGVDPA